MVIKKLKNQKVNFFETLYLERPIQENGVNYDQVNELRKSTNRIQFLAILLK